MHKVFLFYDIFVNLQLFRDSRSGPEMTGKTVVSRVREKVCEGVEGARSGKIFPTPFPARKNFSFGRESLAWMEYILENRQP